MMCPAAFVGGSAGALTHGRWSDHRPKHLRGRQGSGARPERRGTRKRVRAAASGRGRSSLVAHLHDANGLSCSRSAVCQWE